MMRLSPAFAFLFACQSDYKITNELPSSEGADTALPDTDTPPDPVDTAPPDCDVDAPGAYSDEPDESCENEVAVGTFRPIVEYHKASWTADSSSRSIMMTPVVGSLDDDNGDGSIDENDTPAVSYTHLTLPTTYTV